MNSTLATPIKVGNLQDLQADVLSNNQLLTQQQEFINSLTQTSRGMDQTLFGLHNIIVNNISSVHQDSK